MLVGRDYGMLIISSFLKLPYGWGKIKPLLKTALFSCGKRETHLVYIQFKTIFVQLCNGEGRQ